MISVIMPAYNTENYIKQAIESVLNQTFRDIELIIILDCPTDNTEQVAREATKNDDRVRIIRTDHNKGVGGARCEGFKIAKGDYFILADSDDWYDLDFFQQMYDAAIKYDADMVSSGITLVGYTGDNNYNVIEEPEGVYEGDDKLINLWCNGRTTWTCNKLTRRCLWEKVPCIDRRYIEDTPVTIPQIHYANRAVVIKSTGFYHRCNPTSICNTSNQIENFLYRTLAWIELLDFFRKENPHFLEICNVLEAAKHSIDKFNKLNVSTEQLEPYKDLYVDVVNRLFRYVGIRQIFFQNL